MDREATTMSVREMRELLGIKKTDSYWLLKKNCFEVVKWEFIQERKKMQSESHERQDDGSNTFYL